MLIGLNNYRAKHYVTIVTRYRTTIIVLRYRKEIGGQRLVFQFLEKKSII